MTALLTAPTTLTPKAWPLRNIWLLLGALFVARLTIGAWLELAPDEAVYWSWSRHLAGGYFDHPPLIAWINWLSTRLFGSTQFAVRLPAATTSFASVAILIALARRLFSDEVASNVGLMWLMGPLLAVIATISTPDSPAVLFSTLALACAVLVAESDDASSAGIKRAATNPRITAPSLWLIFGFFCGLGMLAKYTTILVPAAVFFALLTSRTGRVHLRQPWIYLAALLAVAVFSPVIWWNYKHDWASFGYQLRHGTAGAESSTGGSGWAASIRPLENLAAYLGGQAMVWTPILFGVTVVVLFGGWRNYRRTTQVDRVLLWCATFPLLLFAAASWRKLGEVNWPMFTWFPASLLIGRYLMNDVTGARHKWVWEGCKLALIFAIVLHVLLIPGAAPLLGRAHVKLPHNVLDVTGGWRRFGQALGNAANGLPVVCNRHQDAGEAAFYMPGQPDVWCDSVGSRLTAFDFFDQQPDYANIPRLIFVGSHVSAFAEKHGYSGWKTFSLGVANPEGKGDRMATLMWRNSK